MSEIEAEIRKRLEAKYKPVHLEIHNESASHSGPGTETHFRVFLVSDVFNTMKRLDRQRHVQSVVEDLLKGPVHAFSQRLLTPIEYEKNKTMPDSPNCRGGSKI